MKKGFNYILRLILIVIVFNAYANEKLIIDNDDIQSYKGRLGIWKLISNKYKLKSFLIKVSCSEKEVRTINSKNNIYNNNQYFFIPYSEKYIEILKNKGIQRTIIEYPAKQFLWPIDKVVRITSVLGMRWGKFHAGLDIPAPSGVAIRAAMEGVVTCSKYAKAYGNMVEIEHRNGYMTRYAHNKASLVNKGDFVKKGQIIALVGSTGRSTGAHLHFEIRINSIPLDPLDFLPEKESLQVVHRLKNWKTK